MTSSKLLFPVAVLVVGGLAAAALMATGPEVERRPPEVPIPLVRVVVAQSETIQHRIRTHGTVDPRTESELIPEVSGPVIWVSPSLVSGGFFAEGEPLLRIDREDYEIEAERARAALARADSQHRLAERELERRRGLAEQHFASDAELDDSQNAERVAKAARREARAAVRHAERDLERAELRAPYDGRVREARIDVGQFASRGAAVATLYAVDYAEVRLPIPDDELAYLDRALLSESQDAEGGTDVILHARFAGRDQHLARTHRAQRGRDRPEEPHGARGGTHGGPLWTSERRYAHETRRWRGRALRRRRDPRCELAEDVFVLPRASLREQTTRVLVVDAGQPSPLPLASPCCGHLGESVVVGARDSQPGDQVCVSPLDASPWTACCVRVAARPGVGRSRGGALGADS